MRLGMMLPSKLPALSCNHLFYALQPPFILPKDKRPEGSFENMLIKDFYKWYGMNSTRSNK